MPREYGHTHRLRLPRDDQALLVENGTVTLVDPPPGSRRNPRRDP